MLRRWTLVLLLASLLAGPAVADGPFDHEGPYLPPILDFFLLRPPAVVATALGTAVWTVCLPFNLIGGWDQVKKSTDALIVKPGRYAFVDRLGSH